MYILIIIIISKKRSSWCDLREELNTSLGLNSVWAGLGWAYLIIWQVGRTGLRAYHLTKGPFQKFSVSLHFILLFWHDANHLTKLKPNHVESKKEM